MSSLWSVWLLPNQKDRMRIKGFIEFYNSVYKTLFFDPHITLFGRLDINPNLFFSFFNQISLAYTSYQLSTNSVELGEVPWKTIYIGIEHDKNLFDLQKKIDRKLGSFRKYLFNPHLSLAYGNFTPKKKDIEVTSLKKTIHFSSIALVSTPDQIEKWEIIKEYKLREKKV